MADGENKGQRLLGIFDRLSRGELISKEVLAREYGVTEKSIQRDIDDIRSYLAGDRDEGAADICYDRQAKGYRLVEEESRCLTRKEILAMAKILLESRAFAKEELHTILDKLIEACPREGRKVVEDMIRNETFCYVPPRHGKKLLDALWDISLFIKNREIIRFSYKRQDGAEKEHTAKPVALLFSEFYFYLVAYKEEETEFPTIFRVDRIGTMEKTENHFQVPYQDRFKDGEFRKRVQFMYPGVLRRVTFTYSGPSVEAVLDRLPTARILSHKDGIYTLTAEAYGKGLDMWLGSQEKWVKVLQSEEVTS
ncbi:YafY family protein [uncultured Dialister sp.]|jgi:predicted DNA-binding transcriptional regulator YafY|uniref:helix-turn-helix transcriptional regulator n=1 Tax=uncultured Dialister sp. TaxID=278064 RepID=UPI0025F94863|nr:WYL domain-containing protein [uncultured Dialister sp.]